MSFCTSGTFSIAIIFPLSLVAYLLIADWDKLRSSATCLSFILCFFMIALAMRALIAGKTVLTPTSHGSSNFSPAILFLGEIYINVPRHKFYDVCHDGVSPEKIFLTPISHSFTRHDVVNYRGIMIESDTVSVYKRRKEP